MNVIELKEVSIYLLHAIEDFVFNSVLNNKSDETIIFSTLKPGISISSNQNYFLDIDEQACKKDNIDVTRRITGGRSMYFDENYLILSIIIRNHNLYNVDKNYENTLEMIMQALNKITNKEFSLENKNDIMIEGRKIGGAAQRNSQNSNLVHCYLRVGDSLEKMLKYVKIDNVNLHSYYSEIRPSLTSLSEIIKTEDFYERFKELILKNFQYSYQGFNQGQLTMITEKVKFYQNSDYIKGKKNFDVKGNCDIIAGSGKNAKLKIKSLEGKVKFS